MENQNYKVERQTIHWLCEADLSVDGGKSRIGRAHGVACKRDHGV